MNNLIIGQLTELHIPLNEAKVYVVLAEIGQTSAGDIIKRTKLHRSVVYESLDRLIDRKLVFKLKKQNVFYFQATDPSRILAEAKAQQRIAESVVPKLNELLSGVPSEINVYEGLEAYRRFWVEAMQHLPIGSTDYIAGSIGKKWQEYMSDDLETFQKIRVQRKIKWKMLVYHKNEIEIMFQQEHPALHEYRLMTSNASPEGNFNILGNESVILHSAKEPLIIEVKNVTLVKVFQNLFNVLWEAGKELS